MPEDSIAYRPTPRWVKIFGLVVLLVIFGGPGLSWFFTGELKPRNFIFPFILLSLTGVARLLLRSRLVVDAAGADHVRRRKRVPWDTVDRVRRPGSWDPTVALILTDGTKHRTPHPPTLANRMAAIGGVPLED